MANIDIAVPTVDTSAQLSFNGPPFCGFENTITRPGTDYNPKFSEAMGGANFQSAKDKLRFGGVYQPHADVKSFRSERICTFANLNPTSTPLKHGIKESPGYRSKMEDHTVAKSEALMLSLLTTGEECIVPDAVQKTLMHHEMMATMLQSRNGAFRKPENLVLNVTCDFHYVGVFDGHGGDEVSKKLSETLIHHIERQVKLQEEELERLGPASMDVQFQENIGCEGQKAQKESIFTSLFNFPRQGIHDSFASRSHSTDMEVDCLKERVSSSESESESDVSFLSATINNGKIQAMTLTELKVCLETAFLDFDNNLPRIPDKTVGSTGVISLISDMHIIVANVGDSRAVLCRNGVACRLSRDQKPDEEDEEKRIRQCGGRIWDFNGKRVMGLLAMTRAFGDDCLKPYGISATPEVTILPRVEEDQFIILACDGLWDVLSDEEACELVKRCFNRARERSASAESACRVASSVLFRAAFAKGSNDNISVVVVDLRKNGVNNDA